MPSIQKQIIRRAVAYSVAHDLESSLGHEAGLMARTFVALWQVPVGFEPDRLLTPV